MRRTFVVAMVIIFVVLGIVFLAMSVYAPQFQTTALHVANAVMLCVSLGAYVLINRKIAERPQAFVQGVLSASFMKLMLCMCAMLAYVLLNKDKIHKPTIFVLLGVYAAYSATETILISKIARTKNK